MADLIDRLSKGSRFSGANPKWVAPENLHLTLWFLGATPMGQARRLASTLPALVEGIPQFRLDARHLGFFPTQGEPRVLWVGIFRPPAVLTELRDRLGRSIVDAGIALPEEQQFTPHITLARLKGMRALYPFKKLAGEYRHHGCGTWMVPRVVLMQSTPGKGGSTYSEFASADLAAPPPAAAPPSGEQPGPTPTDQA